MQRESRIHPSVSFGVAIRNKQGALHHYNLYLLQQLRAQNNKAIWLSLKSNCRLLHLQWGISTCGPLIPFLTRGAALVAFQVGPDKARITDTKNRVPSRARPTATTGTACMSFTHTRINRKLYSFENGIQAFLSLVNHIEIASNDTGLVEVS